MIPAYPNLRQLMRRENVSYKELSNVAGMSKTAFCLSLWGFRRWKFTEAVKICCFFQTENIERVFVRN